MTCAGGHGRASTTSAIVIPIGSPSLAFLLKYRQVLGFDGGIVHCCVFSQGLAALNPPVDATGVTLNFDLTWTPAFARRLQPDAPRVAVAAGSSLFEIKFVDLGIDERSVKRHRTS